MGRTQQRLPGTETARHPDISKAAAAYVKARDERMKCLEREIELHGALLALMQEHELSEYVDDDQELRVTVLHRDDRVRVRKIDTEDPEASDLE